MATINHRKVTVLPDDPASDLSADEWNDALVVRGSGATGDVLIRDTGAADGWGLTTSITLTSLTVTGTLTANIITPSTPIGVASGGTGLTSYTAGDLLYATGATTLSKLAIGASGTVLVGGGSAPSYSATPSVSTLTTSGNLTLGSGGVLIPSGTDLIVSGTNSMYFQTGGALRMIMVSTLFYPATDAVMDLGLSTNRMHDGFFSGSLSIGTNPATTGAIRVGANNQIGARNAANTADIELMLPYVDDVIYMGSGAAGIVLRPSGPVKLNNYPFALTDGITAPSTVAGYAQIYVDTADGDLKVKFGDGVVKTIVVDT